MFLTPLSRRPSSCQNGTVVLLAKAKRVLYATLKCPPPGEKSREGVIRWWQSFKTQERAGAGELVMPAVSEIPTSDGPCFRPALSQSLTLTNAKARESSSPIPSERVCKSGEYMCVPLLTLIHSTHSYAFQVKSFVDSANNGLDGVRISLLHNLPFTQPIAHSSGHPSLYPRTRKRFCHLQHRQGRLPFLRARWIRSCDCAFGRWM